MRFQPGVVTDQVEHGVGARLGGHLDLRGHLRFGYIIVLEDQPVTLAVVLDEVEEGVHGGSHPLPVIGGGAQRLAHARNEVVGVPLQHGEIELKLGRKVLVENGFTHARTIGDLVHACGVVAAVDENLAGSGQ